MNIFKKIGGFFKTVFIGAYMWSTIYFAFVAIFLTIGAFFLIAKFGNGWHLLLLIAVLTLYIYYWKRQRK